MAELYYKSRRRFILGTFTLKAVLEFSVNVNQKLVEYNFPFAKGIDYEDNGEGEVTFNLNGLIQSWRNIGNNATNDVNSLRSELLKQSEVKYIKFVHPDLVSENVKIRKLSISQNGEMEGFKFDCELVKVTPLQDVQLTQASVEKDYEAKVDEGKEQEHTVVKGDTLYSIAKKYLGDGMLWRKLWQYSDNKNTRSRNPNLIYPGEKFKIPQLIS